MQENEPQKYKEELFNTVWQNSAENKTDLNKVAPRQINLLRKSHKFEARIYNLRRKKVPQFAAIFALFAIILSFLFQSAAILTKTIASKPQVLGTTKIGLEHLEAAQELIKQNNFAQAQTQFALAEQNFIKSKIDLNNITSYFSGLVNLSNGGKTANAVLDAGKEIALAGTDLSNFYLLSSQIKPSPAGFDAPDGFYGTANAARKFLEDGNSHLQNAAANLKSIDLNVLPIEYRQQFSAYQDQIDTYTSAISQMDDLLMLMQTFIGNGQKSILVLFENNNELRPTGGFICTYGFYKLNNGKVISQKISSIYDLDGQLKQKIAPPGALSNLTDSWALRDSNWFVDFKQSAQKVSQFYEMEGGETPDAVIAITPDFFVDLLNITGPINFSKYNIVLSASNFRQIMQENTSSKDSTTPKQMLADFAPLLLQNLFVQTKNGYGEIASAIFADLAQKNILFYDRDPNIEQKFSSYNWSGNIAKTDNDYLAVYDTNLGGEKTSLNISQTVQLQSDAAADGSVTNTLTYTRKHEAVYTDPINISYLRFLVPLGSQLISAEGFTTSPYFPADGSAYSFEPQSNFKLDPDLQAMDATTKVDPNSGTVITTEAGKTEFANWSKLLPEQSQTVVIKYRLPFNISSTAKYSFLMQKQPGALPINLTYTFNSPLKYAWYTPYSLNIQDGSANLSQDLKEDLFVGFVFDK